MKELQESTSLDEEEVNLLLPELQEYAWQAKEVTWSEQALHLLRKAKWTDCTFVVGRTDDKTRIFHCHKALLAKSSSVFEKMLFGLLKEMGEVRVTDVEPPAFQELLEIVLHELGVDRYLYTGEVHLHDEWQTCDLFLAADKYLVLELRQRCLDFLQRCVSPRFAIRAFEVAKLLNLDILKDKAWRTLLERTDEVIACDEFLTAPHSLLLELSRQEALHLSSEAELIRTCYEWALRETGSLGDVSDTAIVRGALGPVFQLLRFCSLSVAEFTAGPLRYNMLTSDEKVELLSRISEGKACDLPGFSPETNQRAELRQPVPHFTFWRELNNSDPRHAVASAGDEGVFCTFNMRVDSAVLVCGFRTATKVGRCFVTIQDEQGRCVVAGRYDTSVGCTSGGRVEFEPAVALEAERQYRVMLSSETGQCLLGTGRAKEARNLYAGLNLAGNEFSFVPLVRYLKT